MKKYFIMMSILSFITAYGAESPQSNEQKYRMPLALELIEPGIENGAYIDFLRVVDEINRGSGKKDYINKESNSFDQNYEKVDLVPIAQYGSMGDGEYDKQIGNLTGTKYAKKTGLLYPILKMEKDDEKIANSNIAEDMNYQRFGSSKRFYFGNGNRVKDIIITNKDNFAKINKEDALYNITGVYTTISKKNQDNLNPLDISLDEYHEKIEGKSKNDPGVLKFIKDKMVAKNIDVEIKNNDLWTTDNNGIKHRVLWNFEPVSLPNDDEFLDKNSNKRFNNVVMNSVYTFSPINVGGKLLYKKDGSIIIENPIEMKNSLMITTGWDSIKTLDELEKEYESDPTSGNIPYKYKEYFKDKKSLSSAELDSKYGNGLINNPDFKRDLENYQKELKEAASKYDDVKNKIAVLEQKSDEIEKSRFFPEDYYTYTSSWNSDEEKEKYFNSLIPEAQKLLKEYVKVRTEKDQIEEESYNLYSEINETIPKKYGFYEGWGADETNGKWASRVIKDKDIVVKRLGKNIEFRGKGRIDGTIDFGDGENYLTISEQLTGKFGTNITLGPDAVLKNIKAVLVGGQVGASTGDYGLSGKTSLSIEIDPTKINEEGYIYQHALKDTWLDSNKIIFSSNELSVKNRNNFGIELKVSTVGKDSIIDMGRPLTYKATPLSYISSTDEIKTNDTIEYNIPLYSDSIAHQLSVLPQVSKRGDSLVQVHILDRVKRLSNEENEVYKSMKSSGYLGALSDTLSSSTKKTVFSGEEDLIEKDKIKNLITDLRSNKDAATIVKELSHFDYDKNQEAIMLSSIRELKNNPIMINNIKQEENMKKYQKENFDDLIAKINKVNPSSLLENDRIKDRSMATEAGVRAKIEELKGYYTENIKPIYEKLNSMKPANGNEDLKAMKDLRSALETMELESTFWIPDPDKKLAEYAENFDRAIKLINEIKSMNSEKLIEDLEDSLERLQYTNGGTLAYKNLIENLYYTQRQEESLRELKTLISEVKEKNIYAEVNKISKNEIDVFTPLSFNNPYNSKKPVAFGGALSGRFSKGKFKGNIYTAYGVYEFSTDEKNSVGLVLGGGASNHKEIKNDTLESVTTESKISGTRAYIGAYDRYKVNSNISIIGGIGTQYGKYKVDRDFRNNYQRETYKGKLNTVGANLYTGVTYTYKLNDSLELNTKALISYTLINQGKVTEEKKPLSMNVNKQNFNYIDGEVGVNLTKYVYSDNITSSVSGGIYGVYGIAGYDNKDLTGQFDDSSSSFGIKGRKYRKDSVKIQLEYNVLKDNGFNYGLEGNYITNANEDNISVGVKAGYRF